MSDEPIAMPNLEEITGAQLVTGGSTDLAQVLPKSYATYRAMRSDPTIALARALSVAPIVGGEWAVEADDKALDEDVEFIRSQMMPIREPLIETAMYGGIDFGWQPYEKVFAYDSLNTKRVIIRKVKPLLHDITKIQVDKTTGVFAGFSQKDSEGNDQLLPIDNALLIPFRVEGTQWHGQSLMENARGVFNNWNITNKVAARYDKRVAGANFVVKYPQGSSKNSAGAILNNEELAKDLIAALEGTGSVIIPNIMSAHVEKMNKEALDKYGWHIDILSDGVPKQYAFVPRLRFLDVQKVRALLIPERAVLEGVFGTKAEAGAHADIALTHMELLHKHITRFVNWYIVDQLLAINFGDDKRGTIRLVAAPLADQKRAYLQEVYAEILKNPTGFLEELQNLNTDGLKDTLGIPKATEVAGVDDDDDDDDVPVGDDTVASLITELKSGR